jgi:diaminopimelate decarboxylase
MPICALGRGVSQSPRLDLMSNSRIVDPRKEADAFAGDSRSDARRAERVKEDALARLASDLCGLSAKKLGQLGLSEELVDAVSDGRAIPASGAYHLSMSSNYNGSRRPAVIWLEEGKAQVIVQREMVDDLLKRDLGL